MEDLPHELIEVILSFNPGFDIGKFCQVSTTLNNRAKHTKKRMYLIYKVRDKLIQNCYNSQLRHRHFWYWECVQEMHYPFYEKAKSRMTLADYHQKKVKMYENSSGHNVPRYELCTTCYKNCGITYYTLIGRTPGSHGGEMDLYRYCYDCYRKGVTLYYNQYKELPVAHRACDIVYGLLNENARLPAPDIPPEILPQLEGRDGGRYHWDCSDLSGDSSDDD